jgi:glycogen debranching enzyme
VKRSGLWRGPTWISGNWFLVLGLLRHGFRDEATELTRSTLRLVTEHGFREFFNPFTGEPYGANGFAWSTLAVDMVAALDEQRA